MLLHIPDVLSAAEAQEMLSTLVAADWIDGRATAGHQSMHAKNNMQLAETNPLARDLGDRVLAALSRHPLFMGAALPLRVFPPLFNRYEGGGSFGVHVDNAVRQDFATGSRIRTDLSATLFLAPPDSYDGGELLVEDTYGTQSVKLPPGHLVLYPSTSLHQVMPVTRGSRICSFFWIQSMIRDDFQRTVLFDLDVAIQRLSSEAPGHPSAVQLMGVYHNLVRMWAEV